MSLSTIAAHVVEALRPGGWVRELALDCLALLWPTACVGCGHPDRELCLKCAGELDRTEVRVFNHEGLSAPCFAAGPYEGVVRSTLVAYKHQGAFGFARPLGKRLAHPLRLACVEGSRAPPEMTASAFAAPVVVTLPSRARRERERGYRHVDELVRVALRSRRNGLAEGLNLELMPALAPLRGRTGQVGLDSEAREANARRITVRRLWAPDLLGRSVILVDDIITTGATMRAATQVLEAAGARVIAVVSLCVAVRHDTP